MSPAIHWSAIAFILAAFGLVVFMLAVPRLLGGRSAGLQKEEVFESGVVSAGNARIRLSAKFYLVAIFFVIFDLEALYLYAYAVSVREVGWVGFTTAAVFIAILFVGLVYELRLGAMNWAPADKRKRRPRLTQAPAGFDLAAITQFNGIDELHTDPTGKVPAQSSGVVHSLKPFTKINEPTTAFLSTDELETGRGETTAELLADDRREQQELMQRLHTTGEVLPAERYTTFVKNK